MGQWHRLHFVIGCRLIPKGSEAIKMRVLLVMACVAVCVMAAPTSDPVQDPFVAFIKDVEAQPFFKVSSSAQSYTYPSPSTPPTSYLATNPIACLFQQVKISNVTKTERRQSLTPRPNVNRLCTPRNQPCNKNREKTEPNS